MFFSTILMKRKSVFVPLLLTFFCLSFFSNLFFIKPVFSTGENWLNGWSYRKSHLILNSTGAETNYQIQIIVKNSTDSDSSNTVCINNKTKSDFTDIRFTSSDGITLLSCWNQTLFVSINITLWVKVTDNLSSSNSIIYIYYGNSVASDNWNGTNTFLSFDDFNDGSLSNIWEYRWYNTNHNITIAESSGLLKISRNGTGSTILFLVQNINFTTPLSVSARMNSTNNLPINDTKLYGLTVWNTSTNNVCGCSYNYPNYEADVWGNINAHNHVSDSVLANTFYVWNIISNSSGSFFYKDDIYKIKGTYVEDIKTDVKTGLLFYFESTSSTQTSEIDYFFTRKQVTPEPINSIWGTEEVFVIPITFLFSRFTLNNSAPYQGESVFFNGTSSNCSSTITSFLWNLGDNTTIKGNTTTHKYLSDGIFTVNLTVVSGSMHDTFLFQITVLATTITVNFDLPFFLLLFFVSVCLILSVFRIPIIGFVFSAFAIGFSAWTLTDTSLPLYGLLNMFVAVIGAICLYLNVQKFVEIGQTKKKTSKLTKRF